MRKFASVLLHRVGWLRLLMEAGRRVIKRVGGRKLALEALATGARAAIKDALRQRRRSNTLPTLSTLSRSIFHVHLFPAIGYKINLNLIVRYCNQLQKLHIVKTCYLIFK